MIALANDYDYEPSVERSNTLFKYRTLFNRSAIATVDRAMEVCSGAAFFRNLGLQRCFRDIQGRRFHRCPRAQIPAEVCKT